MLRVTGLCAGNSPETGEFLAQRASKAENVSIWWHHHVEWLFTQTMFGNLLYPKLESLCYTKHWFDLKRNHICLPWLCISNVSFFYQQYEKVFGLMKWVFHFNSNSIEILFCSHWHSIDCYQILHISITAKQICHQLWIISEKKV